MKLYFNSFTYLFIYQVTGFNSLSDDSLALGCKDTELWSLSLWRSWRDGVIQFAEG